MPLFFFISGYFAYNVTYNWELLKKRSYNRIIKQFYPTIILWLVTCLIFQDGNINDWLLDSYKGGYWFTFVSVEMFFTIAPFLWLFSKYDFLSKHNCACLLGLCILIELLYFGYRNQVLQSDFFNQLSLWHYFRYIPFFIMGMITKIQKERFNHLCYNIGFVSFALIIFVFSFACPQYSLLGLTSAITGIIITYSVFYYLANINSPLVIKTFGLLSIIGTSTLEIYLLHYFFIYSSREMINLDFLASISGTLIEFPIYFIVSVFICVLCLLCVRVLKKSHVYGLLFPSISSKKVEVLTNRH